MWTKFMMSQDQSMWAVCESIPSMLRAFNNNSAPAPLGVHHFLGMWRELMEPDDILAKHFAVFTLELKNYPFKDHDLNSNTHTILFLNDNDSVMSIMTFTSRVSVEREKHVLSLPMLMHHSRCCWSRKSKSLFNHTLLFLCYRHLSNKCCDKSL